MEKGTQHGFWYSFNLAAIILIILFLLGIPLVFAFAEFIQSVDLSATQRTPAAAFIPTTFTIEVANTQNTPLNAVEFELQYDPQALLITSIIPHDTLCEEQFIIANTFDNASGTALFQCGTIAPFTQKEGTVATVHAIPLSSGTTSILFGELTHVIAHDGFGTDVTRERNGLAFTSL
jgi:hypothetical protein